MCILEQPLLTIDFNRLLIEGVVLCFFGGLDLLLLFHLGEVGLFVLLLVFMLSIVVLWVMAMGYGGPTLLG